jgi:hypothetical protein
VPTPITASPAPCSRARTGSNQGECGARTGNGSHTRHAGLVPASTVPQTCRPLLAPNGGPRDESGVTGSRVADPIAAKRRRGDASTRVCISRRVGTKENLFARRRGGAAMSAATHMVTPTSPVGFAGAQCMAKLPASGGSRPGRHTTKDVISAPPRLRANQFSTSSSAPASIPGRASFTRSCQDLCVGANRTQCRSVEPRRAPHDEPACHQPQELRAFAPSREPTFLHARPTPKIPCHRPRKNRKIPCQFPAGREIGRTAPRPVPPMFRLR